MAAALPRIGITARYRPGIRSHCIQEGYVDHVARAGGLPLVIPYGDVSRCSEVLGALDGLMLTGGEDIDPSRCTGTIRQDDYTYYPERDDFELRLTRAALDAGLPTLGICRGCQILHVATGGSLISHVPDVLGDSVAHRSSLTEPSQHFVSLTEGSRVERAYAQRSLLVTSYHHQGLRFDARADSAWQVTACADDSLVEAIEYPGDHWTVGVLWHPELPVKESSDTCDPLIAAFVAAAGAA
ncbi:gamma-glutamyl-gamma-aminobutyrate hydrolase family protein [Streptomyces sp. NPDC002055]|uniref:gamma-glutamyl-gamma-aminobutyrate hydrolase family protein n=1 Tax=Streptomyces sp. NPDC002055 TaxID=3154534 RepID=UPI00331C6F73